MAVTKLDNAAYLDTDWQDEIASKDLLKIGYSKIEWEVSGDDVIVKADSAFDIAGNIYLVESDETITGPITDKYITFNGTVFSTDDTALLWDEAKNGYYLTGTNTRVIGYLNAGVMQSVIKDVGFLHELNTTMVNGDVTGDLTGNVTGNVTGDVTGDVTGNLDGYVTGGMKLTTSGSFTTGGSSEDITLGTNGEGLYLVSLDSPPQFSVSATFDMPRFMTIPAGVEINYGENTTFYWWKFG